MTNSTKNVSADISMSGRKLEEMTNFKYLGATLAMMAPTQQIPHQDCLSNGSNGQTKEDLAVQRHQSFRKEVHEEFSPCLLLGSQDQ